MRSFSPEAIFAQRTVPSNPHQHHHKGVWSQRAVKRSLCTTSSLFSDTPVYLSPSPFTLSQDELTNHLLNFQVTTVSFQALSVFGSLFQTCFTFPLILLSVHPSVSFLSPSPAPSLSRLLLLLLLAVAVHIAVCKQEKNK